MIPEKIIVYGHSDDLVYIEAYRGEQRIWCEEFGAWDAGKPKKKYIAISDGTLLSICYTEDGIWSIVPVVKGQAAYEKTREGSADGREYSDIVQLTWEQRSFAWVAFVGRNESSPKILSAQIPRAPAITRSGNSG